MKVFGRDKVFQKEFYKEYSLENHDIKAGTILIKNSGKFRRIKVSRDYEADVHQYFWYISKNKREYLAPKDALKKYTIEAFANTERAINEAATTIDINFVQDVRKPVYDL